MKIENGRNRIVIIFKNFVVKLPKVYFLKAIHYFYNSFKDGWLKRYIRGNIQSQFSLKHFLLGGISANWYEFTFYQQSNRRQFLLRTYFSLFGLFNIQKRGKILALTTKDEYLNFWGQLKTITEGEVYRNPHTFSNPKNYCMNERKLVMVDYASKDSHPVIEKYGNKIFEQFDFTGLTSC